jgi:hypothetical protein
MSSVEIQQVAPGPCPPVGCPPATEIVCVYVPKVFDFCFEQDLNVQCTPLTEMVPVGTTAECTVTSVNCVTGTSVPTGVDGFAILPITVTLTRVITLRSAAGLVIGEIVPPPFVLNKTIVVCKPDARVTCACDAIATCGDCTIIDDQICCQIGICLIVECDAPVKLLLPSFGFCTPTRCTPAGFPPGFTCPPADLFPPQCTPTVG